MAGLTAEQAADVARKIGIPERAAAAGGRAAARRCTGHSTRPTHRWSEINPLILTGDNRVVALDAKMNFDDNALFRHPEIVALRDLDEEDPAEIEASKFGLSYISLDGNIGCLVNGAGSGHGDHGHHQAVRRRARQLPGRGRRRHHREGDRGVQADAEATRR